MYVWLGVFVSNLLYGQKAQIFLQLNQILTERHHSHFIRTFCTPICQRKMK